MSDEEKEIDTEDETSDVEDADEGADTEEENDDPDSEDGDSDDVDENDESGEKSTAGADEEIDWKARAEETSKRLDKIEQERNDAQALAAGLQTGKQQKEREAEEKEKLLRMTPEERMEYRAQQAEKRIEYVEKRAEFKAWDANDRADYAEQQAKNPILKKYAPEVEKRVELCKKAGHPYTRKDIAIRIAGERAMASAEKGGSKKQKAQAQGNVDKSRTSGTKATGDRKMNGKTDPNSKEARNERLRNTTFT